jgi:hypothetical protein
MITNHIMMTRRWPCPRCMPTNPCNSNMKSTPAYLLFHHKGLVAATKPIDLHISWQMASCKTHNIDLHSCRSLATDDIALVMHTSGGESHEAHNQRAFRCWITTAIQRTQSCIVTKPISPKYHRWCPQIMCPSLTWMASGSIKEVKRDRTSINPLSLHVCTYLFVLNNSCMCVCMCFYISKTS